MRLLCYCFLLPPALAAESILAGKALRHLAARFDVRAVAASDALFPRDPDLATCLAGVDVRRLSAYPGPVPIASRRALLRLAAEEAALWIPRAARAGGEADVLYSRSEPGAGHLAALRWRRRRPGTPWVAHFSDPWATSPYRAGHPRRLLEAMRRAEADVCAAADWFVFPSETLRERFARDHPRIGERSSVLPHGYEPDWYPAAPPVPAERSRAVLAHVGDFYGLRSPEPLLQACDGLGVELRLYGRVARPMRPLVQRPWVRWVGPVPYRESLRAMVTADLLVVVEAPGRDSPFLPSKLIDYLGARRPVVGLVPPGGPTAALLGRYGFPFADVADPAACRQALRAALDGLPGLAGRAAANDYAAFEMPRVGRRLAELIAVLGRGARPG